MENIKDALKGWLFKIHEKGGGLVHFCMSEFLFSYAFSPTINQVQIALLYLGLSEEKYLEGSSSGLSISSCSQVFFLFCVRHRK